MKKKTNAKQARDNAYDLVERFIPYTKDISGAIECALICLDELREASYGGYEYDMDFELPFYNEIEQELRNSSSLILQHFATKYWKYEKE